ncbi:MAG: NADH-quinone oxidoreductase subunit N [Flavobacteriales bacterium]
MKELIITSLLGISVLALEVVKLRKAILPVILLGLLATIVSCFLDWGMNENPFNNNMLLMDNYALSFIGILSIIAFLWFVVSSESYQGNQSKADLYALVAFSLCGGMILSSYTNMVMLFLGIEILSIPMYVLAASNKTSLLSNEAGFKYFFLGAMASAILLFGIALIYGATGSFDLAEISAAVQNSPNMTYLGAGILMILVGFAFKVSLAPFHLWAPDVYQGSPTMVTALMSTLVKGAAFAAMFRLFHISFMNVTEKYEMIFVVLAMLTLIISNAMAAIQSSVKRMLAYSSISHAGFMIASVMTVGTINAEVLMYYVIVYSISSLVAFTVLYYVSKMQEGAEDYAAFKGLVKRNPILAGALTLALLSMAGIPPLSGFMAKYFIINEVLSSGNVWLAIVMILSSAVAVFYYLKVIVAMFTPIENAGRIVVSDTQKYSMIILSVAMIGLFAVAAFV